MGRSWWFVGLVGAMLAWPGDAMGQTGDAPEETPPEQVIEISAPEKEQHFRIGLNGFAAFDSYGDDAAAMKIGAAVVLPHFDVMIKYGLGFRLGFNVIYHQARDGSVKASGEIAGVDMEWLEDKADSSSLQQARVPAHVFSYGMAIDFKYEVTVPAHSPAYRFFRWVQPYFGVGVVLSWTRTHTDIPKEMSVLINNEAYQGADPESEYDPWAMQFGPAFDLFGGFHFNLERRFRINVEIGYFHLDVPGGEPDGHLRYSTDGHEAHHLGYKINDLKLGGGLEWKF